MGKKDEILVPANLPNKAAFGETLPFRWSVNREAMTLLGGDYMPGELVFLGYRGSWQPDRSLVGEYVFRLVQPKDAERDMLDLNQLPSMPQPSLPVLAPAEPKPKAPKKPKKKKGEEVVDNGSGNTHGRV